MQQKEQGEGEMQEGEASIQIIATQGRHLVLSPNHWDVLNIFTEEEFPGRMKKGLMKILRSYPHLGTSYKCL